VASSGAPPFRIQVPWYGAYADSFQVIEAKVEGAELHQVVLPVYITTSNGMGVDYWTVYALSPGSSEWMADSLAVQDYSIEGSWVAVPGERRCNLLETSWVNGFDPRRGGGLYFQAAWRTIDIGAFTVRADRPVLRRRLLYSFERERGGHAPNALQWLRARDAAPWVQQPQ
jgi:hypothetical protein